MPDCGHEHSITPGGAPDVFCRSSRRRRGPATSGIRAVGIPRPPRPRAGQPDRRGGALRAVRRDPAPVCGGRAPSGPPGHRSPTVERTRAPRCGALAGSQVRHRARRGDRQARDRRATRNLPATAEALRSGSVSTEKAKEIAANRLRRRRIDRHGQPGEAMSLPPRDEDLSGLRARRWSRALDLGPAALRHELSPAAGLRQRGASWRMQLQARERSSPPPGRAPSSERPSGVPWRRLPAGAAPWRRGACATASACRRAGR
jgi:hypothetical protein